MSYVDTAPCPGARTVTVWERTRVVPCGLRGCARCGVLWEGDQRARASAAAAWLPEQVALITVTGPGRETFDRWEHEGVGTEGDALDDWNRSARRRWRVLHAEASREARRWARTRGCDWRVLYRVWEYQERGVLHVHLVLPFHTYEEREVTGRYVRRLWELSRAHGFGYVLGGGKRHHPSWRRPPRIVPAGSRRAAHYVAKYVSSMGGTKSGMRSTAMRTAKRGSVLYVTTSLTRRSGLTMRSLRARRAQYAGCPASAVSRAAWEAEDAYRGVTRGRPPMEAESARRLRAWFVANPGGRVVVDRTGEVLPGGGAALPRRLRGPDLVHSRRRRVARVTLASVRNCVPGCGPWSPPETRLVELEVL